eukprot:TRINITY_DN18033_c0_g1_i1.p1 TRINITY_DN18033_c0_g1~~TRINITY_DN18033_c0_g1_i1.p1  ORF type:complete len:122 (+),score=30.50 TRINITY_DN18033_c0_g1_i1:40-366(+)
MEAPQADLFNASSLQYNLYMLTKTRLVASIVLGIAAGLYGFTNLQGIGFYVVLCGLIVGLLTKVLIVKSDSPKFFRSSWSLWTEGLLSGFFTYLLFWAVSFNVVYIYF